MLPTLRRLTGDERQRGLTITRRSSRCSSCEHASVGGTRVAACSRQRVMPRRRGRAGEKCANAPSGLVGGPALRDGFHPSWPLIISAMSLAMAIQSAGRGRWPMPSITEAIALGMPGANALAWRGARRDRGRRGRPGRARRWWRDPRPSASRAGRRFLGSLDGGRAMQSAQVGTSQVLGCPPAVDLTGVAHGRTRSSTRSLPSSAAK